METRGIVTTRMETTGMETTALLNHSFNKLRYVLVVVCALVNAMECSLKVVLSLTIVPMKQEFKWDEVTQGHILGGFYYGTIITHLLGGQLASYFGARRLTALILFTSAILTVITPLSATYGPAAIITVRVLNGLAQGPTSPAAITLLSHWIPVKERSRCLAVFITGGNIGSLVVLPVAGFLSTQALGNGWPSVFYFLGASVTLTAILWLFVAYDAPESHPWISASEKAYIMSGTEIGRFTKTAKAPWLKILTSAPVWAIVVARFANSWTYYMLATKLPSYCATVLGFPLNENGVINALVYLATIISMLMAGFLSDIIEAKHFLNRTTSRKLFEIISQLGTGISLALISFSGANRTLTVALFISSMLFSGLYSGGSNPNIVDVAPNYSGSIYGLSSTVSSLCGILAPLIVGYVLDLQIGVQLAWNAIFYSSACVSVFGAIVFAVLASAEPQPWGIRSEPATLGTI